MMKLALHAKSRSKIYFSHLFHFMFKVSARTLLIVWYIHKNQEFPVK